jgi:hypothetical protein
MDPSEQENTPPELPEPSTDESEELQNKEPAYTRQGNGYVSRLPRAIRDQIGIMILDGVPHAQILQRIGDPVKHLKDRHITGWKKYSYGVWLEDFKRNEALHTTHESAAYLLAQKAGVPVQDAGRTVAAAQLYEFLITFNPKTFAAALEEKPELYLRIITTLARLSEGEAACAHHRALQSAIEAKLEQTTSPNKNNNVVSKDTLTQITHETKLV